ncbi:hypothetical protein [Pseudomonas silesiensis]
MNKKTLAELVGHMQGKSLTYGWDALTLYDQRKANELLFQLYVERFNTEDGYITPADLEASWGDGSYKEHLFGFKLSAPRLSFESSDPSLDARARLTMDMISGMIVSTRMNEGGAVSVSRLLKILPVGGPQLWMDQPITKGVVTGPGDVVINLNNADTFMANFVVGDLAMEDVGQRFKEYFKTLSPKMKLFSLGRLSGDTNGVLTPKNFEIRTMRSDPLAVFGDENYGDGAVMMFITLKDGQDSNSFPNKNSTYLIPADEGGTKYTGAMLLSSRVLFDKIMRGPATTDIGNGIEFLDYTPENGGGSDVAWSLKGARGGIDHKFIYDYTVRSDDWDARFEADLLTHFELDAGGAPLTIKAAGNRIEFVLSKSYTIQFKRTIYDWGFFGKDLVDDGPLSFACDYSVSFDIVLNNDTGLVSFNRHEPSSRFNMKVTGFEHLFDMTWEGQNMIPKIEAFFQPKLFELLRELSSPTIDTFLIRNLLFPGENALQLSDAFVPGDLAVFGQIDPLRTSTVLAPLNSTIEAGSKLQFTLTPMPENVQWSVKDVDGNIAQPGAISATGEYTAPSVDELPDGFVAVMVTAEGTLGGNAVKSSALVSVLNSTIVTNPLYDSCESGKELTLSGQSLAQTELQWTILTPQWGSTLQIDPEDSNRRIYTAGKNMDKDVPYPIDKVEIKDPDTGAASYISVRIVKALTVAPMVLGDLSDLPNGKAHFQLQGEAGPIVPVPGITLSWNKLAGPGDFDAETGIYTEPDKIESGEFVVLSGTASLAGGAMKVHGHIVLPLPLSRYAEMIQAVDFTLRSDSQFY